MDDTLNLTKKYEDLKNFFKGKNVVVAYSGGVDSTLISKISSEITDTIAVTIDNSFFSKETIKKAETRAKLFKIPQKTVKINYLTENVSKDIKNRCYNCKAKIAEELLKIKNELNYDIIVDGTIYDDIFEDRPGIKAFKEKGIISPLLELKFTKKEVLFLSEYLNLEIPLKDTCMATRILSQPISLEKMNRSYVAEEFIKSKFHIKNYLRVRHFENIAIIEINKNESKILLEIENIDMINKELKKIGFKKVTFDFEFK
ncbi:conserved hypothetical protein [Methanococcus vannielii SB]|uniref:Uncharacterized protein n=1 Tax=Methanococcus vannielii (strain ATCC 35089 / DSM 1224 / JCM 13029 / OCM 148 / SB) TaxID=406327 RepID=A6UPN8_METVS|nr:ATP-dependent sacrificial sulfur transferase LarE [Methanococcus vannielii]ABR54460.1 conserved hypothetical protein [Methanococcus vannielii SB]